MLLLYIAKLPGLLDKEALARGEKIAIVNRKINAAGQSDVLSLQLTIISAAFFPTRSETRKKAKTLEAQEFRSHRSSHIKAANLLPTHYLRVQSTQ